MGGQPDTRLRGVGREPLGKWGLQTIGVMSTNDEVSGTDRKKLGVMKSDDEGQTDAEVKDSQDWGQTDR